VSEAPSPDAGATQGPMGSVSAQLQVPVGSTISMATYTLTGPNSFYRESMLTFPATRDVSFGIDKVPATDGYNLDVTLTSPDGANVCTSSAQFGVTADMISTVVLIPHCSQPPAQAPANSTLQLTVDLPSGITIPSLDFTLSGANGFRMHDTWDVTNDSALLFVVQNIPAGTGDAISLSATTSDGTQACTGGTTLTFEPNTTTKATLVLLCQATSGGAGH
jgi:hypothetical protein